MKNDQAVNIPEEDLRCLLAYADLGCQHNHRNGLYDEICRRLLENNPDLSSKIKEQIS